MAVIIPVKKRSCALDGIFCWFSALILTNFEFRHQIPRDAVNRAMPSAQIFTDPANGSTLSAQLRWSHFSKRLLIKAPLSL